MKNIKSINLAAMVGYGALKLSKKQIDPYTRAAIGTFTGFLFTMSSNVQIRMLGIGTMIVSALELLETNDGGKLVLNESKKNVWVLDELNGSSLIENGQQYSGSIDGFAIDGMKRVFKVSDGVYVKIKADSTIQYAAGLGKYLNENLRNSGFKDEIWVDQQSDVRWRALFDCANGQTL